MSEVIKALVNSKKYQDARVDDEPIYVNGKIGGGMDRPRGQAGPDEEDVWAGYSGCSASVVCTHGK